MSDEIRKEEVDITTAEDPIESIERTVEELKQKIIQLSKYENRQERKTL